jgi:hypothetical protein
MRTAEMCSCTDSGIVVLLFLPGLTTIPAVRTNGRTAGEPPVTDSSWRVHARAINASNAERRRRRAERSVGWRECAASERAAPAQSAPAAAAARARSGRNAPQKLTSGCGMSSSSIVRELQAVRSFDGVVLRCRSFAKRDRSRRPIESIDLAESESLRQGQQCFSSLHKRAARGRFLPPTSASPSSNCPPQPQTTLRNAEDPVFRGPGRRRQGRRR